MVTRKNMTVFCTVILLSVPLFGCATTYVDHGSGIIIAEKKLKGRDFKAHGATKMGAAIGGGMGATSGAIFGGVLGLGLGSLGNLAAPMLAVTTFGGAAIGAVIVGGAGAITGGGLGYGVDHLRPNTGLYQFIVKPENSQRTITVTQYTTPIPIDSKVHILEKNRTVFIKQ